MQCMVPTDEHDHLPDARSEYAITLPSAVITQTQGESSNTENPARRLEAERTPPQMLIHYAYPDIRAPAELGPMSDR